MRKESNLDKCIQAANESGLTYGQYMNQNYDPDAAPPETEQQGSEDLAKIGTKVCEYCGKEFPVYDKRSHKYCCKECAQHANYAKARQKTGIKSQNEKPEQPEALEDQAVPAFQATAMGDIRIKFAKMILRNAAEFGNENNYLTSIENALDILSYEGDES